MTDQKKGGKAPTSQPPNKPGTKKSLEDRKAAYKAAETVYPRKLAETLNDPMKRSHEKSPLQTVAELEIVPSVLLFKIPLLGTDNDDIMLQLTNTTNSRLTYKLTGTKCNKFDGIENMHGYVESCSSSSVKFKPYPWKTIEGFTDKDKFMVHYAILSSVDSKRQILAEDLWKKGNPLEPKLVKTVDVPMRFIDAKTSKQIL